MEHVIHCALGRQLLPPIFNTAVSSVCKQRSFHSSLKFVFIV